LIALNYETKIKPTLVELDPRRIHGIITGLRDKGFGFLSSEGKTDLFFHADELRGVLFSELRLNDCVIYSVKEGQKGPIAVEIERA
jgi:CspA family cold shock protein